MRTRLAVVLLTAALAVPGAAEAQTAQPSEPASPVAVRLGGDPVIYLQTGLGGFPTIERVRRIEATLADIVGDRDLSDLTVRTEEVADTVQLVAGEYRIVTVTDRDAALVGMSRALVAEQWASAIQRALTAERARYTPRALLQGVAAALLATLIVLASLWAWRRGARILRAAVNRPLRRNLRRLEARGLDERAGRSIRALVDQTISLVSLAVILVLADAYLTFVLGLFPWTRAIATRLLESALSPVYVGWQAFIDYLPSAFFLVFIAFVALYAIRFTRVFFDAVDDGRLEFQNFPSDWADPTFTCARAAIIALALVVAYPYLPGAGSPAFTAVSVFAGVLLSLASSSSLSNMVGGLVLTYSGAFKLGDRVQVGGTTGDVIERGLLATRVRTPKNVEVVVPNSVVLGGQIVNYSAMARAGGIALHTTLSLGYDVPWRQAHELLVAAARATSGILDEPAPFVLQTALGDFYVTYELNAYTDEPADMPRLYSDLHVNIQDGFNRAGVEILSPHHAALRRSTGPVLGESPPA